MSIKVTQEEFIERSNKVHNNKYNYSKTIYTKMRNKIIIICPVHGEFDQLAMSHVKGTGCSKCNKVLFKDFEEKAKKIHQNKYIYFRDTYINTSKKTKIYCTICNKEFWQRAGKHIQEKQGCPYCANNIKFTKEEIIRKIEELFPNKFTFEKLQYSKNDKPIIITCKKHGDFKTNWSTLNSSKYGCMQCMNDQQSLNRRETNDYFIKKSKKIHGENYSYSFVDYKGHDHYVTLKCNICQTIFEVKARIHYQNKGGCPSCNFSEGERSIEEKLSSQKIKYIAQKKFNDCKNKMNLSFDFYLPNYNLCIEYDGKQHFESIEFFGGETHFHYRKRLDQIKTDYCHKNNIVLLRIPYWEKDNIDQILKNKLTLKFL